MQPLKATLLDDDAFRLLAIPYGGPIPSPHSALGVDLDGEWFDERTDIRVKGRVPVSVPVDWHHGADGYMKSTTIGEAEYDGSDEEGHWVRVWLRHGERRLALIRELADRGAQLFGSSKADPAGVVKSRLGHIEAWPYIAQALSTSPQNTYSVLRPMKAALGVPTHEAMRDLASDLRLTLPPAGDDVATGRRLAAAHRDLDHALEVLRSR